MTTWSAIAVVVIVATMTYAMRAVAIVALAKRTIPLRVELALRNVGPAVLAALAINLAAGGEDAPSLDLAETIALMTAGVVAWRTRSVLWTLLAGMIALWLVDAFV